MPGRKYGDLKRGVDQHICIDDWCFKYETGLLQIEISLESFKEDAKRRTENRIFDGDKGIYWLNDGTTIKLYDERTTEKLVTTKIKCENVHAKPGSPAILQIEFSLDI